MNCLELRRALGADPNHASPESLAHRAQCASCEKYAQEMLRLNGLIKRALDVPVRSTGKSRSAVRTRWYAIAASLLLIIGFGGVAWFLGYPRDSLANAVVAHMGHEPDAMRVEETRIAAELLEGALRAKGLRLTQPLTNVSYLQSCLIRGDFVPHLVVQTDSGPVTVMLLPKENVSGTQQFADQNYQGVLVPIERGSVAVIASDAALAESVANTIKAAIVSN